MLVEFAEDGLVLGVEQNQELDDLVGNDGLRCRWGIPQTDIIVAYANWERDTAAWQTLKTDLIADGYVETGPFVVSSEMIGYDSAYRFRDGVVHYASPGRFLGWVTAVQ